MATRDELMAAIVERYGRSNRAERGQILNEFVAVDPNQCIAASPGSN
jgi:hypothetical protein